MRHLENVNNWDKIQTLIKRGAIFYCNHSGGKDSQAMYAILKRLVPSEQLVVLHAPLGEVEHTDVIEHIENNIDSPIYYSKAIWKDGSEKTFINMVEDRGQWPSRSTQFCTSSLKTGPLDKIVRRLVKDFDNKLVVNCMGIRAKESTQRAKKESFKLSEKNSKAGREWYEWFPIFELDTSEVFEVIEDAGQKPHWAYARGMSRLSCCFCILASKSDLQIAAQLYPNLLRKYVELEKRINHTMKTAKGKPIGLLEFIGINESELAA